MARRIQYTRGQRLHNWLADTGNMFSEYDLELQQLSEIKKRIEQLLHQLERADEEATKAYWENKKRLERGETVSITATAHVEGYFHNPVIDHLRDILGVKP